MAAIAAPFDTSRVSGYDWGSPLPPGGWNGNGESYGWTTHQGVDYGTRAGQPIRAPFNGTVKFEQGLAGYGNRITLTLANGFKFIFGHVAAGANGPVAAGQIIGTTGQNIGSSVGSVTLVEVHNPQGVPVNPHTFFDPIFRGTASLAGLFGAASAQLLGPRSADSSTSPSADSGPSGGPNWWAGFQALLANLQAFPAEAGHNAAVEAASAQSIAGSAADIASGNFLTQGIKGVLPSSQHVWRAFFVGLGIVMIGVGALIYFKGDAMVAQVKALPGEAEEAGADAASVAAPEAAPAIQSAKRASKPKPKAAAAPEVAPEPVAA